MEYGSTPFLGAPDVIRKFLLSSRTRKRPSLMMNSRWHPLHWHSLVAKGLMMNWSWPLLKLKDQNFGSKPIRVAIYVSRSPLLWPDFRRYSQLMNSNRHHPQPAYLHRHPPPVKLLKNRRQHPSRLKGQNFGSTPSLGAKRRPLQRSNHGWRFLQPMSGPRQRPPPS